MTRLGNLRACARLQVPLSRIFAGLDADCPTRPLMPPPISVLRTAGFQVSAHHFRWCRPVSSNSSDHLYRRRPRSRKVEMGLGKAGRSAPEGA
jgi:hypothetical protein